ncbi:MAG: efflux RND transporter periplasmic adaptor subunit [Hyphomicrobiaceae bacterium]|nr:efflux RND transporter periplasmic adaptor subunit [Hyphomicrobiaceae bacterium]
MTVRRSFSGLAIALTLVLIGCDSQEEAVETAPRPVRTVTVDESRAGQTVELAGTVESQVEVDLAFRIGGRMTERLVRVGDTLEAGQVVARLDPSDEENGVRAAEASLASAEAVLSEARLDYDRQRHLFERQVVARVALERAEQVRKTAEAAVGTASAQLGIARRRLDDTELLADAPGVVVAVGPDAGEVVQPGQMIAELARDDGKDAVFNVAAALKDQGPADPEILVRLSQNPSVTANGRVREVSPRADTLTGTFRIRVGLIDPPPAMRLGSTVVGRATFGDTAGIELPASALTQSDGEPAVWVVDPEKKTVSLRQIGVERFSPSAVTVADGLEIGDIVVTAGVQALRPDQEVRLLGGAP